MEVHGLASVLPAFDSSMTPVPSNNMLLLTCGFAPGLSWLSLPASVINTFNVASAKRGGLR